MLRKSLILLSLSFLVVSCSDSNDRWAQEQQARRGDEAQEIFPDGGGDYGAQDEEKLDHIRDANKPGDPENRRLIKGQRENEMNRP